jgi:hypothetical protein
MKYILFSITMLLSSAMVDAAAWTTPIVECSKVKQSTNVAFQACATTAFAGSGCGTEEDGKVVCGKGYNAEFWMTTGLKEGTDIGALSESARKTAYKNGIAIQVALDEDDMCTVTVNVKEKSSECKSCKHCGNHKFTVDCTNVANGRKTTCESAEGSRTKGESRVFFPLKKSALSTPKPPTSVVVKTPVAAPVKKAPSK